MAKTTTATGLIELLRFDDLLSNEELLIQQTVRSFVADKVKPRIAQWYEDGESPRELIPELGQLDRKSVV